MRRSRQNRRLLAGLICALASYAVVPHSYGEEVYKTSDAAGHVIYSDRPSSSAAEKVTVTAKPADAREAARLAKQHALEDAEYAQRSRQEADEQSRQDMQSRQDAAHCAAARSHYTFLKDVARLFRLDAEGNRIFYSDEEADAMRATAKQAVEQACGK
jgi:hypothetical protein